MSLNLNMPPATTATQAVANTGLLQNADNAVVITITRLLFLKKQQTTDKL